MSDVWMHLDAADTNCKSSHHSLTLIIYDTVSHLFKAESSYGSVTALRSLGWGIIKKTVTADRIKKSIKAASLSVGLECFKKKREQSPGKDGISQRIQITFSWVASQNAW